MNGKRFIRSLKLAVVTGSLLLLAGCSSSLYQASGVYTDDQAHSRKILMQWEAQEYYIPFVEAKVDYGSISLQAECMQDVFLDYRDDEKYGFIFVERANFFKPAMGVPELHVDNFLVCAKFEGNRSIEEISGADNVRLFVLCESTAGNSFLPPKLSGYSLSIRPGETKETLHCGSAD